MRILFYDGECGLCDQAVQFVLRHDHSCQFHFAPLQGETADALFKRLPKEYRDLDSLILVEGFATESETVYVEAKGALRIAWLLGGAWRLPGVLHYLPGWMLSWGYRLVARNRHRIWTESCVIPPKGQDERFLP